MTLVDRFDAPPRRRIGPAAPTKEQIEAITDIAALEALHDDLYEVAKKIEVDLEFEVGDDDWDKRARVALTHFRVAASRVDRQIKRLRRDELAAKNPVPASPLLKSDDAQIARDLARAEEARRATAEIELKALHARHDFARSMLFRGAFIRVARAMLTPEQFCAIVDAATEQSDARTEALLSQREETA